MADEPLLQKLTADELATWLTVTETMAEAQAAYGSFELAANTIASRLKVHALRTGADFAGIEGSGKLSEAPVEISPQHWALWTRPTDPDFWKTGELHLTLPLDERRGRVEIFGYYGVKFEPVALRALLASIPKPPPGSTTRLRWRNWRLGSQSTKSEGLRKYRSAYPNRAAQMRC
jgi:hypothetical protein